MRKARPATSPLFLVFLLLLAIPVGLAAYSHVRIVRLSLVEGEVYVARPGEAEWTRGVVNLPLVHDAVVETVNGVAEVEFESGAFVRLATDARLHLAELGLLDTGGRVTQLSLERGTATFYAKLRDDDSFIVLTPYFQVSVAKRAKFRVDLTAAGGRVRVFTGQVNVDSPAGTLALSKDRMFEWYATSAEYLLARNPDRDAWDEWNDDRDDVVHAKLHDAIPAYLTYGLHDLAHYGYWRYLPSFGQVWLPWVGPGWVPFMYGRWLWYAGFGWTWVSFEPWGWLPYHYGSWYYHPFWGWVWVPGFFDYWSPARCFWVRRPGWVGWAPVPPPGIFQGGGSAPARPRRLPEGTVLVSEEGFARGELPRRAERLTILEEEGHLWQVGLAPPRELLRSIPTATGSRPLPRPTDRIEFDRETGRYVNLPGPTPRTRFGTESQQRTGEAADEQRPARPGRVTPATPPAGEERELPPGTVTERQRGQRPSGSVVRERPSVPSRPPVEPPRSGVIQPSRRGVQHESPPAEHTPRPAPRASPPERPPTPTVAPPRPMPRPEVHSPASRPSPPPMGRPPSARPRPESGRPRPE